MTVFGAFAFLVVMVVRSVAISRRRGCTMDARPRIVDRTYVQTVRFPCSTEQEDKRRQEGDKALRQTFLHRSPFIRESTSRLRYPPASTLRKKEEEAVSRTVVESLKALLTAFQLPMRQRGF
jgi:hypothetical protein